MPVFLITGYDGQETIFYRETPHQNGVGPILNEAISKLSSNPNSMIIIESLHEDSPEPQMEQHIPHSEYQDFYVDEWDAESTKKSGKVITMSGKPHKPRKLKQDKGISPEEAINRISFRSESTGWVIDDITIYDDTYGSKADGSLYNPDTNERIEFEEAEISMDIYIPPMENIYVDYDEDEDLESVVEASMMEAEGFYDDDGVGPKHMASEGANPSAESDVYYSVHLETLDGNTVWGGEYYLADYQNEKGLLEEAEFDLNYAEPAWKVATITKNGKVVKKIEYEAESFEARAEGANPSGGATGDQIVSWEHNGLSSPSGPPSDIFWAEGSNKLPVAVIDFEGVSEKYKNMSLDELADLDIQELADNFDIETLIELRIMAAKREAPYWKTKGVDFDFENESFTDYPSGIFQEAIWAHNEYGAEGKKNCGCGQDPCKTYGAEINLKTMTDKQLEDTWFREFGEFYTLDELERVLLEKHEKYDGDELDIRFRLKYELDNVDEDESIIYERDMGGGISLPKSYEAESKEFHSSLDESFEEIL